MQIQGPVFLTIQSGFIAHVVCSKRVYISCNREALEATLSACFPSWKLLAIASLILDENLRTFSIHLSLVPLLHSLPTIFSIIFFLSPLTPLFHLTSSFPVCYFICSIIKTYTKRNAPFSRLFSVLLSRTTRIATSSKILSADNSTALSFYSIFPSIFSVYIR